MKKEVGLWIDHRQAVLVTIMDQGEKTKSKNLRKQIVSIETTDKLTDPQIAAKVRQHYPR